MGILDAFKSLVFVQETPVAVETKAQPVVSIAVPAVSYPSFQVINTMGLSTYGQPQPQLNPVFLSILGRVQAAARVVEWKAVWVKADGTETNAPTSSLTRLLARPNADQTWAAFVNQYLTQLLQHGNVFIYCTRTPGPSLNAGQPQELRIMPAATEIIGGQDWRTPVVGYKAPRAAGGYDVFPADEVLHVKKWQLSDTSPYGLSPVQAAALQLQNLTQATRQRIKQLADGGPAVIMYNQEEGADPFTEQQEQAFVRKVAGPDKFTYVNGKFGTAQIGLSPVDLDIINSVKLDAGMVADLLMFPAQLLSTSEGNTFSNVDSATKALYSDCVLPLLWELQDGLNQKLGSSYTNNYQVRTDTTGVESLKPNLAPMLTALAAADYLSVHQKLDLLGIEKLPGNDAYILTKGATVATELKETPPAPATPAAPGTTAASGENGPANAA